MKNGERNCNKIENGLAPKKWNKNLVNTSAPHFYDMRFGVCVWERISRRECLQFRSFSVNKGISSTLNRKKYFILHRIWVEHSYSYYQDESERAVWLQSKYAHIKAPFNCV